MPPTDTLPLVTAPASPIGLPPQFVPSQQMLPLKITLQPGETRQFSLQGQWFYVKECYANPGAVGSDDFTMSTDITGPLSFNVGTGIQFPETAQFRLLQIENPTALEIYVEIVAGYGTYIDNRLNIVRVRPESTQPTIEPPIEIDAQVWTGTPYTVAAGSFVDFTPVLVGNRLAVKGFEVANADPNVALHIADSAGNIYGRVVANTSQIFPCSQAFRVINSGGTAVTFYVGILYWLGS